MLKILKIRLEIFESRHNTKQEINKKFEVDAIIPKTISEEVKERLLDKRLNGVCISTESDEFGIYKSFNYAFYKIFYL